MVNAAQVVIDYLDAFTSANIDGAKALVADEFQFTGPVLQADGKKDFFDGAEQLVPIVRGYNMLRQWEDGDDVCSMYEFNVETPVGTGSILMTEWNTVRDGKLTSARLVFDTAEFNALMPEMPEES